MNVPCSATRVGFRARPLPRFDVVSANWKASTPTTNINFEAQ